MSIVFFPPLAFGIVLLLVVGMSLYMRSLAFRGVAASGSIKSYACGEDVEENSFSPDYSQFFSFAFFFHNARGRPDDRDDAQGLARGSDHAGLVYRRGPRRPGLPSKEIA